MVLYDKAQRTLCLAQLTADFSLTLQENLYASFSTGEHMWSLRLPSPVAALGLTRGLGAIRAHVQVHGPSPLDPEADHVSIQELVAVPAATVVPNNAESPAGMSSARQSQCKVAVSCWFIPTEATAVDGGVALLSSPPAAQSASLEVMLGSWNCPIGGIEQGLEGAREGKTDFLQMH